MPFALVSLHCLDDDTMKKMPAIQFFETREEAVNQCAKELTYTTDDNPADPFYAWNNALKAAIARYLNDPDHYPIGNYSGGEGTFYLIRETADRSKETRRSLYATIMDIASWSSVNIDSLKVVL